MTPDELAELARSDDYIHYSRFEDLLAYVGDDSVRLVIKYVDADGGVLLSHIIDKAYKPSPRDDNIVIDPNEDISVVETNLKKYCNDNTDRLIEEYNELFDGAVGPNCYVEDLNLILEYRYTKDITRQQFFEIIEETASRLKPIADELAEAISSMSVGLIIRCFDANGEKLLDYPIGGLNINLEF